MSKIVSRSSLYLQNQKETDRQRCLGMYSRKSWGGSVDPFILTKFFKVTPEDDSDPIVSLIIFEWEDEPFIGRYLTNETELKENICYRESVDAGLCNESEIGAFILAANATEKSRSVIKTQAVHLRDPPAINYPIRRTGYYCVSTYAFTEDKYKAVVEFRNAYGELPAAQIAKLPFYGGLTIVYAVIGV